MDVLFKRWECKSCKQIFKRDENLTKHLKQGRYAGGKTKIIYSGGKFRHIFNSSKKVFYGGDTIQLKCLSMDSGGGCKNR